MNISTLIKSTLIVSVASFITLVPTVKPISDHAASITNTIPSEPIELTEAINKPLKPVIKLASYKETPKAVQPVIQAPVSSNDAKAFIYQHESGNNPAAINPGGCRGLGQACPGTKLPCGNDYACQDAWFTNYMQQRYGTWENAKDFWLAQCSTPKGCWW